MTSQRELVVVGAGPAGLMAALTAAGRGHRVTVLEAAPTVGGMAGSIEVAGLRVDLGSHRLHPATDPGALDLIRRLLGDDLQLRPRRGRIRLGGRWIGFPLRAAELARRLPPALAARLVVDAATRPLHRATRADSFEAALLQRLGPTVTRELYGPYARKLYGLPPAELDVELADRRVSARSPAAVAARALQPGHSATRGFFYPRRGFGQIAEALADAAVAAGVELHLSAAVDRIDRTGPTISVGSGGRAFPADVVLSTMPLPRLASALHPPPGGPVRLAVDRLRTRAMVLAYLVLDRPRWTPFDAHYLPADDVIVSRVSEPKNYRHNPDDPADRTVLCAEVPCWLGDELWQAEPSELAARVIDDLGRSGLAVPTPAAVEARRLPAVYPVYERATRDARAMVDGFTRANGPVLTLGRQGLGVPDNLHHVLAMGAAAAGVVTGPDPVDHPAWCRRLDEFASHVVQD